MVRMLHKQQKNFIMLKKLPYFFLLFLLASVLFTCKKYPEGPRISLRTKVQRLEGRWVVEKYLIDGADSTAVKYPNECYYNITNKEHTSKISSSCDSTDGRWEFNDNRTSLILKSRKSPLVLTSNIEWKIMKLKFREMHLQTNFNSKQYDIYFTKP